MAPGVLRDALKRTPFQPFRLVQTDGTAYEVRHPDQVWVGLTYAVVGVYGQQSPEFPERFTTLDLLHLMRLEPIPTAPQGNGQQG
jgi:hypothetical protein